METTKNMGEIELQKLCDELGLIPSIANMYIEEEKDLKKATLENIGSLYINQTCENQKVRILKKWKRLWKKAVKKAKDIDEIIYLKELSPPGINPTRTLVLRANKLKS